MRADRDDDTPLGQPWVDPSSDARRRTNAVWLRAQLEDLRFASAVRVIPNEEWRRALDDILAGRVRGVADCSAELARYRSTRR